MRSISTTMTAAAAVAAAREMSLAGRQRIDNSRRSMFLSAGTAPHGTTEHCTAPNGHGKSSVAFGAMKRRGSIGES